MFYSDAYRKILKSSTMILGQHVQIIVILWICSYYEGIGLYINKRVQVNWKQIKFEWLLQS